MLNSKLVSDSRNLNPGYEVQTWPLGSRSIQEVQYSQICPVDGPGFKRQEGLHVSKPRDMEGTDVTKACRLGK